MPRTFTGTDWEQGTVSGTVPVGVTSLEGQTGPLTLDMVGAAADDHGHTLADISDAGTAAAAATGDFATAAQGGLADTAVQPGDLSTVATSGAYSDLTGTPTLGTAAAEDVEAFDPAGTAADEVADLPELRVGPGLGLDTSTPGFLDLAARAAPFTLASQASNTTTETQIGSVTIPAGIVLGDMLWITAGGTFGNSSGGPVNFTLRLKQASTTVMSWVVAVPNGGGAWRLAAEGLIIDFLGHRLSMSGIVNAAGVAATVTAAGSAGPFTLPTDIPLAITVQMATAAAGISTLMGSGAVRTAVAAS